MQPRHEPSDWSVLSGLLRAARGEGWQVVFHATRIEIHQAGSAPGVVMLPARLLREAREAGWQVARAPRSPGLILTHQAVLQRVDLVLGG